MFEMIFLFLTLTMPLSTRREPGQDCEEDHQRVGQGRGDLRWEGHRLPLRRH